MEQGDFEMADRTKVLLEEGQRHRRRQYEASMTRWTPAWFEIRDDPTHPGRKVHQYKVCIITAGVVIYREKCGRAHRLVSNVLVT